jgi:hypothetical protein
MRKIFVLLVYIVSTRNWMCRNYIHPYFNICIGYWQSKYCSLLNFLVIVPKWWRGKYLQYLHIKPFHKWNIIGSRNYMGIAWTWFFGISIPMGPQFYHEGIAKSRSILIQVPLKYDWSIICNTFIFCFWCCDEKYLKGEKV